MKTKKRGKLRHPLKAPTLICLFIGLALSSAVASAVSKSGAQTLIQKTKEMKIQLHPRPGTPGVRSFTVGELGDAPPEMVIWDCIGPDGAPTGGVLILPPSEKPYSQGTWVSGAGEIIINN